MGAVVMLSLQESLRDALQEWRAGDKTDAGQELVGVFVFPDSFPGFAGHFPEQPVLPAIIQLAAVRHLAELALGQDLVPQECQRAKFRDIVQPQEELTVKATLVEKENGWLARFSLNKDEVSVSGGNLLFKTAAEV